VEIKIVPVQLFKTLKKVLIISNMRKYIIMTNIPRHSLFYLRFYKVIYTSLSTI